MKKVLTILVSVILTASGMQVTLDRHYCGGMLADVKVSMTGKMASCGMEESESVSLKYPVIDKQCCEDQVFFYSISNNYYPEYSKLTLSAPEREILPVHPEIIVSGYMHNINVLKWILPPGDNFRNRITQPEICVFRI